MTKTTVRSVADLIAAVIFLPCELVQSCFSASRALLFLGALCSTGGLLSPRILAVASSFLNARALLLASLLRLLYGMTFIGVVASADVMKSLGTVLPASGVLLSLDAALGSLAD